MEEDASGACIAVLSQPVTSLVGPDTPEGRRLHRPVPAQTDQAMRSSGPLGPPPVSGPASEQVLAALNAAMPTQPPANPGSPTCATSESGCFRKFVGVPFPISGIDDIPA